MSITGTPSAGGPVPQSVPRVLGSIASATSSEYARSFGEAMRVLLVAGIPAGVVVAGLGSRVAMFVLRLTSPDGVRGAKSDDGFTIGRFTLSGSYNLAVLGAVVGLIGAAAYQWVRPWLIGPVWLRRTTVGAASAAVVGSMLLHADGIDFVLLKPTWLAISLFVLLPGVFGVVMSIVVDRVGRPNSWTAGRWQRWALPIIALVLFPPVIIVALFAAAVLAFWLVARELHVVQTIRTSRAYAIMMRAAWLLIAVVGLIVLLNDISEIA